MQNMKKRVKASEQDIDMRLDNFNEVIYGYTKEEAIEEAGRCLRCKTRPCVNGCPINNDIPEFISKIAEGKIEEEYKIVRNKNNFPAICGRVCPQEDQCEGNCVRGRKGESIAIGLLERFCADYTLKNASIKNNTTKNNIKIAVIGSGPAGLACARDLAENGYSITVFEALDILGGILIYGIPKFRLPRDVVNCEIEYLRKLGVQFILGKKIGKDISINSLYEQGFKVIFLATGANNPKPIGIEGENLIGVYYAYEYLMKINLFGEKHELDIGKKVAVIGGGNVAMDAARVSRRLGAEDVCILYRRTKKEMPARHNEVEHAEVENIKIIESVSPVSFIGENGKLNKIELVKTELIAADESGKARVVEVKGSNFFLEVDTVVIAIGQEHDHHTITDKEDKIDTQSAGGIFVHHDTMETTKENIFAGGDVVSGGATVIEAIKAGKKAAKAIDDKFKKGEYIDELQGKI